MVFEEVGVFVEVDCFQGQFAETFASVGVRCGVGGDASAAEFGTGAVLFRGVLLLMWSVDEECNCTYLVIHAAGLWSWRWVCIHILQSLRAVLSDNSSEGG